MSNPPNTVVGCLLDVSGSMRQALETGRYDEKATNRLRALLRAALKLARAEQRNDPNALMFVGAFGLHCRSPPVVDLCGVVDSLVNAPGDNQTGHELLINLANANNVHHITKYIREKLTDIQSRIIYGYLSRHRDQISRFIKAIPSPDQLDRLQTNRKIGGGAFGLVGGVVGVLFGPVGVAAGALLGSRAGDMIGVRVENHVVENSEALKLAYQICDDWLQDFVDLVPRRLDEVVRLLEKIQEKEDAGNQQTGENSVLDTVRKYMYGMTPMKTALSKSLSAFRQHPDAKQRVLVMVSDGVSTEGGPLSNAEELRQEKVVIATVYLTSVRVTIDRQLYYRAAAEWNNGQRALFNMATKVNCANHPIPVLSLMGWEVPSSGEVGLYATVSSAASLEEFCSLLLSARFGSADVLLKLIGQVQLDKFIDDRHVRTCNDPSEQGKSATCYAHAIAAVVHMALLRIVEREDGYPSIDQIRDRILREFPPTAFGENAEKVLKAAAQWYRLRYRTVNEDGARQAVLHRRPVLTTFRLSKSGWDTFSRHLKEPATRETTLTRVHMANHRSPPDDGGHAVVLSGCSPNSLTFLNSWGKERGKDGSFSVESPSVLEMEGPPEQVGIRFYDVFWYESDLTTKEKEGYDKKAWETLRSRAIKYPSILELDARCSHCSANSPISNFSGNIREIVCPKCHNTFRPEPGNLVTALDASSGFE